MDLTRPVTAVLSDSPAYLKVAEAISDGARPPPWLAPFLESWAPSLLIDLVVHERQPKRTQIWKALQELEQAAAVMKRATTNPIILEFLNASPASPLPLPKLAIHQDITDELAKRAASARALDTLTSPDGRPHSGAGRASLPNSSTPREFCALIIVEAWNGVHGKYPRPANKKVAGAAQLMWEALEAPKTGWGKREEAWRPYFKTIDEERLSGLRREIKRHVKLCAADFPLHSIP